ncbi:hypothetical protein [Streptomyces sp. NPDC093225]|uniref:hypothetical protein n=1 Tax=Streptomyces sp. NPDC093225 TaxID=3366034 RepID=UPI0038055C0A
MERDFDQTVLSHLHSQYRMAEHHTPDGRHSYYVLFDEGVTWGVPGEPQLVGLHIVRNLDEATFDFSHVELPIPAMVQSWLIKRGCPPEDIALGPGVGTKPADQATIALQQRVMGDGDHFAMLYSYTDDSSSDKAETVVLLRALDERVVKPFRVLLEQADLESFTHTLREGAFVTLHAATDWLEDRSTPLPPPAPLPVRPAMPVARQMPLPQPRDRTR